MFSLAKLLVVVSGALVAQAQSTTTTAPTSQPSISACVLDCSAQAASAGGCSSYTDLSCVCTSAAFQQAALACLTANCTTADLQAATTLQTEECGSANATSAASTSASSTGTSTGPSSSGSTTATGTTSPSSGTPSATSAAMGLVSPFSFGTVIGTLAASAGALVGAVLLL